MITHYLCVIKKENKQYELREYYRTNEKGRS